MEDYVYIGSSPADEDCVQVQSGENYMPAMLAECRRFITFIRSHIGMEPDGARLAIKRESHDFGSYCTVVCYYQENQQAAYKYALRAESSLPTHWTD